MDNFRVTFQPSNVTVTVARGTRLLDAAVEGGVLIETPCGGQGRCGRCLVKVEQGAVGERDNPHLTVQQLKEGWVLSCTATVDSDVVVTVPAPAEREKAAEGRPPAAAKPRWRANGRSSPRFVSFLCRFHPPAWRTTPPMLTV